MFGRKKITAPSTHPASAIEKSAKKSGSWASLKKKKVKKPQWSASRDEGDVATYYTAPHDTVRTGSASTDSWRTTVVKPLPVIGAWSTKKQYLFAAAIAVFGLIGAISTYSIVQTSQRLAVEERLVASNIGGMSEALAKNLQRFASGKMDSVQGIASIKSGMDSGVAELGKDGDSSDALISVRQEWSIMSKKVDGIVKFAPNITKLQEVRETFKSSAAEINQNLQKFTSMAAKKELDDSSRQRIMEGGAYLARMEASVDSIMAADEVLPDSVFALNKNALQFKKFIADMESGDAQKGINKVSDGAARELLLRIKENANASILPFASTLSASATSLHVNKKLASDMALESNVLPKKLEKLVATYETERKSFDKYMPLALAALSLALFGFGLMVAIYIKEERRMEIESRATLARNQQAVTQLLNELDPVREGDLTKKVTVSDEYTSTVADAINSTVEEFGGLVKQIQYASNNMSASVEEMGSFSKVALDMSEKQMASVASAADAVTQVEANLQVLARKASDTADLASSSLSVTADGSRSVQDSLNGIMAIQNKVQDTKYRVERLKDTSGQIAEILATIREIAERTNVLAINANLEAKRAGAAGKGFTVVAQSVQDLAKQASAATSKIGALIDSVQSDIEGATKSMNETTRDMSEASRLSQVTGDAFVKIENASNKLSESMKEMRDTVLRQAKESMKIQQSMNGVVEAVKEANDMNLTANGAAKRVEQSVQDLKQSTKRFIVAN